MLKSNETIESMNLMHYVRRRNKIEGNFLCFYKNFSSLSLRIHFRCYKCDWTKTSRSIDSLRSHLGTHVDEEIKFPDHCQYYNYDGGFPCNKSRHDLAFEYGYVFWLLKFGEKFKYSNKSNLVTSISYIWFKKMKWANVTEL